MPLVWPRTGLRDRSPRTGEGSSDCDWLLAAIRNRAAGIASAIARAEDGDGGDASDCSSAGHTLVALVVLGAVSSVIAMGTVEGSVLSLTSLSNCICWRT